MKNIYLIVFLLLSSFYARAWSLFSPSTSVCVGDTINLSYTPAGGIWSCSSPTATIDASTGVLTGVSGGLAYITYTVGASSVTDSIFVWQLTYGPSTVCLGSSIILSDSMPYAWDPLWTGIGGAIAMVDSNRMGITLTGVSLGSTVVSFTNLSGCHSTQTITVTPATCSGTPAAGTATIEIDSLYPCKGRPAVLRLAGHTNCGTTLQWQSSNDSVTWTNIPAAVASTFICNPIVTTHYRCRVTCISTGAVVYSNVVTRAFDLGSIVVHYTTSWSYPPDCSVAFVVDASPCTSTYNLVTSFGDGTTDTASSSMPWIYNSPHTYSIPGWYTIKHTLYDVGIAADSVTYAYEYVQCSTFPIKIYNDVNSNCVKDGGDYFNLVPKSIQVDSSGITIDTITITTGLYYRASGPPGTVYKFSLLPSPGGMTACPAFILDTVQSSITTYPVKYFGLQCPLSAFDLYCNLRTGGSPTFQIGLIRLGNALCAFTSATVTLTHSNDLVFDPTWCTLPPTSIVGNVVSWNFSSLSNAGPNPFIYYRLLAPGAPLTLGDTLNTSISITPISGDVYPPDNFGVKVDTVKIAWDPNDISVTPAGDIPNNTTLEYTVRFENTGNDTAHNIYVLDTLPNNVDPHTLDIVFASAPMYLSITNIGGQNIAKFDFPNINLLDSSHHGLCDGTFVFKIKTRPGLADGTYIPNRVGIYFDANEVVMTNTANNTILIPSVSITATSASVCGSSASFTATGRNFGTLHYRWYVNGVLLGTDSAGFTSASVLNGDAVMCRLVNAAGDSIMAVSNVVSATVVPLPSATTLPGATSVCVGGVVTLTPSLPGGIWSTDNTNATVTAGSVTGVTAGTVTISYTASNICGTATITRIVTVNPLANAGTLSGATSVCTGAATTLSSSQPGGSWTASNSNAAAAVASGVISGVTAGTVVISYSVTNSCGPALAVRLMTVNTLPSAGSVTGASSVCVSATTALTATVSGGTWSSGSTNALVSSSGIVTGISAGTSTISYAVTNMCGTTTASHAVTVNPLPVAGTLSGGSAICPSGVTTLTPSVPGGTWSASNANATVASGVVTGVSSGTVEITYAVTSACGTATATYPITINALPVAGIISGAASVCEGASTVLTSSVPGGIWISGGSGATVGSGLVSGVSAGAVIISYQVTNTCGIAIAMHSMTVNPLPIAGTLTGVSNLCKGQITTLTASVPGGIWSTSGSTATVSAGMVLGNTAGVAIISYAVSNMCGTAYATLPITIDPLPVAGSITGASTVATAGTITLTNAVAGGAWSSSATGIASVNSGGQVTGISPGIADIYYTVANNCGAAMATHSITVYPATQVALSHAGTGINIYPNPATSEITVEYAKDCTIRILNLLGQEVYHDRLSRDSQQINIANLASSVYMIQVIRDNGEKITMRLVKE